MDLALAVITVCGGLAIGWRLSRKLGVLAPATAYVWLTSVDLLVFGWIYLAGPDRRNFVFTAMPWPSFDSAFRTTMSVHGLLILMAWASTYRLRRRARKENNRIRASRRRPALPVVGRSSSLFVLGILTVLLVETVHFWDLDRSVLWSNSTYLFLNVPETAGISTLPTRLIHLIVRPLGLCLVGAGSYYLARGLFGRGLVLYSLAVYPFLLAFAQNSRWAPLYVFGALGVILISGRWRKRLGTIVLIGVIGVVVYLKVLLGRVTPHQGLAGTDDILGMLVSASGGARYAIGFVLNVFQGAQSFANSLVISPSYPDSYKLLSFSPAISALDGFGALRLLYQVKIAPVVPIGTYGEAWHFGGTYFGFFVVVLMVWLRLMTELSLSERQVSMVGNVFAFWTILYISQYPVRNGMRLIYFSILGCLLLLRGAKASHQTRIRRASTLTSQSGTQIAQ